MFQMCNVAQVASTILVYQSKNWCKYNKIIALS